MMTDQWQGSESDKTPRKFRTILTPGMRLEIKPTPFPWPSDDPTRVNVHTELFGRIEEAHIEMQEVVPGISDGGLVLVIEKMQVLGLSIAGMATVGEPPSSGFRLEYGVTPDGTFSVGSDGELTWVDVNHILPHLWSRIKGEAAQEGRRMHFCPKCKALISVKADGVCPLCINGVDPPSELIPNYGDPPDGCTITGRGGSHSESFYEGGVCVDCGLDSAVCGVNQPEDSNGKGT